MPENRVIPRYTEDSLLVEISAFEQLVDILQDLPRLKDNAPLHIQKLLIVSQIPGVEPTSSEHRFELPESFPHLSLTGVPLNQFLRKQENITEFTYEGTFTQHIDLLLRFLEENPQISHVNLLMQFQSPDLRLPRRTSPIGNILLHHLRIRSDQEEDIKALFSNIRVKPTKGAQLHIASNHVVIETVIPFINAMYFAHDDPPTSMTYLHGIGIQFSGLERKPKGPDLFLAINTPLSGPFPLTFKNLQEFSLSLSFFQNIQNLTLAMCDHEGEFDPTLFPTLKHLTMHRDKNLPKTLSKLFSTPRSELPLHFRTIRFAECPYSRQFVENFRNHQNGFMMYGQAKKS